MKNYKGFIWIFVLVLLILGFIFKDLIINKLMPLPKGIVVYTDPNGTFNFNYPKDFVVSGVEKNGQITWRNNTQIPGLVLSTVIIPRTLYPKTNFSEAKLVIGWSNDSKGITSCVSSEPNVTMQKDALKINGIPFTKFSTNDAGAGNFYETTGYRALLDGDCYSLEYVIHSTNIGNYSPDQDIKEFDKTAVISAMESIVKSFKFNVNSN